MSESEKPAHGKRLSAQEAVEAVSQIAELTKSDLPLAPALRALAAESGRGASSRFFRAMADRLERGATFAEAIEALGRRMPSHIRAIFVAGAKTGQLANSLEELVDLDRSRLELRRRIRMAAAYPTFLLLMLVSLFAYIGVVVVPKFEKIFIDFETSLPAMTEAVIALSGSTTLMLIGLLAVCVLVFWLFWILPGPGWLRALQHCVPFIGPMRRWGGMIRFSRLMGILLDSGLTLPESLRIAAEAVGDRGLKLAGRRAAVYVENGSTLDRSLIMSKGFPPTLIPLVGWGQKHATLAESFRTAAEIFQGRVESHVGFFNVMLLPCVFLISVSTLPFVIIALFMPLISLVQKLT